MDLRGRETRPLTGLGSVRWDAFCAESDETWFWRTTGWLDYSISHGEHRRPVSCAFAVVRWQSGSCHLGAGAFIYAPAPLP